MDSVAFTSSSSSVSWGAEHRKGNGELIVRMCSVAPPKPLTCLKWSCFWDFVFDSIRWGLISSYHARRIAYATENRNKKILERYRTGEPAPKSIIMAIVANVKLTCPVCRKVNTKYW